MFHFLLPHPTAVPWQDNLGDQWDGNNGHVVDIDGVRYILVNGTWDDNLLTSLDMAINFNTAKTEPGFHSGFVAYGRICAEYISSNLITKDHRTVLVGHSLGAAVASIAGIVLKEKGYNIENVILYGCPTCWGDSKAQKRFADNFPHAKSYTVGNDFTQWLHWLMPWHKYGPPCKIDRIKIEHRGIISKITSIYKDHMPDVMAPHIPTPWEIV